MTGTQRHTTIVEVISLGVALLVPIALRAAGEDYYIGFATRLLIFALAATSLNFIVGYGGMVAFGHAAFFGGGAYLVALLMKAGIDSAWLAWPTAVAAMALLALVIGALSLRSRGVYFIMITLAFAQMIYYAVVSLASMGGDDGLPLAHRSSLPPFDLTDDVVLYWVALGLLAACLFILKQLAYMPYGRALAGLRQNETRMAALGYPVDRLRLACFVGGAAVAALAGALLANLNGLASPAQLYWTQSGMLLVMVILGGAGQRYGGVLGAITLLCLEEMLGAVTDLTQLATGGVLLAAALRAPQGLAGLWPRKA